MKTERAYRMGGKNKRGKPIIHQYNSAYSKSSRSFSFFKYLLFIGLAVGLIYYFYYLHINGLIVWFNRELISDKTIIAVDLNIVETEISHYLFSIANSLIMGVYLSATLPLSGKRSKYISFALIVFVFVSAILSFGYVGIYLYLNFPFLTEKIYISNSMEGMTFFLGNLHFFLLLYAISLIIEAEVD